MNGQQGDQAMMPSPTGTMEPRPLEWTREQKDLIKNTVARDVTDNEFALFLYVARARQLDPLLNQIHAVKRYDEGLGRKVMKIQTGIDGYRLNAERTENYRPGEEPAFKYKKDGTPLCATAHVYKFIKGEWHKVSATAFFDEYLQKKKNGEINYMWKNKPHVMLGKCAEALALRKAFPNENSGLYTDEELGNVEPEQVPPAQVVDEPPPNQKRQPEQTEEHRLWAALKNKAKTNGMSPAAFWVFICKTLPAIPMPQSDEEAQATIADLTKDQLQLLWQEMDKEFAERTEATEPEEREAGSDDDKS